MNEKKLKSLKLRIKKDTKVTLQTGVSLRVHSGIYMQMTAFDNIPANTNGGKMTV